jgi:transcriptional regulator with XRE-family HTH domain
MTSQVDHSNLPPEVDLNQVVAYNIREARHLRGWTQEQLATRLEPYLGRRLTQAGVSSIERAWDGERRRHFDAHDLLTFAMVFNLPLLYFLLPPPGDNRRLHGSSLNLTEVCVWLLGREEQLEPVYERLRQYEITDPPAAAETVETLTGITSPAALWNFRERRKEFIVALLDQYADNFYRNVEQLARIFDQLRQAGIRGFIDSANPDPE